MRRAGGAAAVARVLEEQDLHEWQTVFRHSQAHQSSLQDLVSESWKRCEAWGIRRDPEAIALQKVTEADLQIRLDANADMLEAALPHLEWISAGLGRQPHLACIVDGDGIVLESLGNMPDVRDRFALKPGYDWSERRMGTNGAGTALLSNRPTAVVGSDHFNHRFEDYTCTGAPLHGPEEVVIGAIDVLSPARHSSPQRLIVIAHIAHVIGDQLRDRFRRKFSGHGQWPAASLTPRQTAVLRMVAEGRTGKEIASALSISSKTVEFHKYEMTKRLGIHSTAELTRYAIENDLLRIERR
jgi:transcriptional regulator of acetoin/glycerol metabolism